MCLAQTRDMCVRVHGSSVAHNHVLSFSMMASRPANIHVELQYRSRLPHACHAARDVCMKTRLSSTQCLAGCQLPVMAACHVYPSAVLRALCSAIAASASAAAATLLPLLLLQQAAPDQPLAQVLMVMREEGDYVGFCKLDGHVKLRKRKRQEGDEPRPQKVQG